MELLQEDMRFMDMPTVNMNEITKPKVQIGEEVREMTDDEFAQYQIDSEASAVKAAVVDQRNKDKIALLERLGITAEEAALLLGQ
jgi:hypothetical protein